jgi:putative ABC transport system permease protein
MFEMLWQDLRYGMRMLRRNPAFTAVAVLTLAIGIGANTAIFSVVYALLLRPLPYKDPDRLAILWTANTRQSLPDGTSYLNFKDWKAQNQVFEDLAVFGRPSFSYMALMGVDGAERVDVAKVSANFFPLLGVAPMLGRTFSSEEEAHHHPVAILSCALWRRFGASPQIIGKTLQIFDAWERRESDSARLVQVIGVMPAHFQFPSKETQLWVPHRAHRTVRDADQFVVLGRLKPEVNFRQAQAEMSAVARRLEREYPDSNAGLGVNVIPLLTEITGGNMRLVLAVLFGAVVFVLLIACTNVANLLLARGVAREREFSIRMAIGAGRGRLVGQLLTESVTLSLLAGLFGLLLAHAGIRTLAALGPRNIPRLDEVGIDGGVLAFTMAISLVAGILFGLTPALKFSRSDPNESLKGGGWSSPGGIGSRRTRRLLVVTEFALAMVLLCGTGLLIRSFLAIQAINPGFKTEGVLIMRVNLPRSRYEGSGDPRTAAFYQQALERIGALPGVQSTGAIGDFFIEHYPDSAIVIEGRPRVLPGEPIPPLTSDSISPNYFQAMGVPLLRGRFLSDRDMGGGAPRVAIINEAMARHFWPGEDPIGKRFNSRTDRSETWTTVVGLVGDMRQQGLEKQVIPQYFRIGWSIGMDVVVHTSSDPLKLVAAVQKELQSIDKTLPRFNITTVEQRLGEYSSQRRFQALLLSLFSALSLGLAALGIYGMMHYLVTQRTHEIGIRMALGARPANILSLVMRQGMELALMGGAVGLVGALWLTEVISSLLYGVKATDPATFGAVSLLLIVAALLACYIPARRAAKVDPMVALRSE